MTTAVKTKIILDMNWCGMCKWKRRVRKIVSERGKSHFVYANERGGSTGVQAGHLGPVNPPSILFCFSPFLSLSTSQHLPMASQCPAAKQKGRGRNGVQAAGRHRRMLAKRSISKWCWQWKVPPLHPRPKPVFPATIEAPSHCRRLITAGEDACGHMHKEHISGSGNHQSPLVRTKGYSRFVL